MSNTIFQIKRSSTPAAVPLAGDLAVGELALNIADRRIFSKNTSSGVIELGSYDFSSRFTVVDRAVEIANDAITEDKVDWGFSANQINPYSVPWPSIGNTEFDSLGSMLNVTTSPGLLQGAAMTDGGAGDVDISDMDVLFRIADDDKSELRSVYVPAGSVNIPNDSLTRYIAVDYNGGSPILSISTTDSWNKDTQIPLGSAVQISGILYITTNAYKVGDAITNLIQRLDAVAPVQRDSYVGGLLLGETGTRNSTLTSGRLWARLNDHAITTKNSSTSTMVGVHFNGTNIIFTPGATQWPNTQYLNTSTWTLTTMNNNKYACLWFFCSIENIWGFAYGTNEYNSVNDALQESVPPYLNTNFMRQAVLLGRYVFQKSAATASVIQSAFDPGFILPSGSGGGVSDHQALTGLQGGTVAEYYHMTAAQHTELTGFLTLVTANSTVLGIGGNTSITGFANVTGTGQFGGLLTALAGVYAGNGTTNVQINSDGKSGDTNGGTSINARIAGSSVISIGNRSNIIGGAYDATPFIYGASAISTNVGINLGGGLTTTGSAGIGGSTEAAWRAVVTGAQGSPNRGATKVGLRLALGQSGGGYDGVGYNVRFTSTTDSYLYDSTDTASFMQMSSGGFQFYGAGSGTGGATLTLNRFADINANGFEIKRSGEAFHLNRQAYTATGFHFYGASYNTWQMYMGPPAIAGQGWNGTITPPSGGIVNSWAMRSVVEPAAGYGWTWESMSNGGSAPSIRMQLDAANGNLMTTGVLYLSNLTTMWLYNNAGQLQVQNGNGYLQLGPQNSGYCHLNTDRAEFYFNKPMDVETRIRVYATNTYLTGTTGFINNNPILVGGTTNSSRPAFTSSQTGSFATSGGSLGGLEVQSTSGGAAFISYHRPGAFGAYLGLDTDNVFKAGGWSTMGGTGVVHPIVHSADRLYTRILNPPGASYVTTTAAVTGAIKIFLPPGGAGPNTMLSFKVTVFDYVHHRSFTVHVHGYAYSGTTWTNCSAYIVGSQQYHTPHAVRFGWSGSTPVVYIGELSNSWSYPQVFVHDLCLGYTGYTPGTWMDQNWSIAIDNAAFAGVTVTIPGLSTPVTGSFVMQLRNASLDGTTTFDVIRTQGAQFGFAYSGATTTGISGPFMYFGGLAPTSAGSTVNYGMQLHASYNGAGSNFFFRTRNDDSAAWNPWYGIWHNGNDGSGSGLDADLLDGYNASISNAASTVIVRDASGYTNVGYIHSTTSNSENPGTISQFIVTNGSDNYYRKASATWIAQTAFSSWNIRTFSLGVGTAGSGVEGEIRATNNITAYFSDDRLKTRLGLVENALDKVKTLTSFFYKANATAQKLGYKPVREVGLSAQEVQKVLPEIVVPAPIDEQYLTIRYEKLVPLLVAAINELRAKVEVLENANR